MRRQLLQRLSQEGVLLEEVRDGLDLLRGVPLEFVDQLRDRLYPAEELALLDLVHLSYFRYPRPWRVVQARQARHLLDREVHRGLVARVFNRPAALKLEGGNLLHWARGVLERQRLVQLEFELRESSLGHRAKAVLEALHEVACRHPRWRLILEADRWRLNFDLIIPLRPVVAFAAAHQPAHKAILTFRSLSLRSQLLCKVLLTVT